MTGAGGLEAALDAGLGGTAALAAGAAFSAPPASEEGAGTGPLIMTFPSPVKLRRSYWGAVRVEEEGAVRCRSPAPRWTWAIGSHEAMSRHMVPSEQASDEGVFIMGASRGVDTDVMENDENACGSGVCVCAVRHGF